MEVLRMCDEESDGEHQNLRHVMNTQSDVCEDDDDRGENLSSQHASDLCGPADLLSLHASSSEQHIPDGDVQQEMQMGSNSSEEKFAQTSEKQNPFSENPENAREVEKNDLMEDIAGDGSVLPFEQISSRNARCEPGTPQNLQESGAAAMADEQIELVSNHSSIEGEKNSKDFAATHPLGFATFPLLADPFVLSTDPPSQDSELTVSSSPVHALGLNKPDLIVEVREEDSLDKDSSFQSYEHVAEDLISVKDPLNQSVVDESNTGEGCDDEAMNCSPVTQEAFLPDSFAADVNVGDGETNAVTEYKEVEQEDVLGKKGPLTLSCNIQNNIPKDESSNSSVAKGEDGGCKSCSLEGAHEEHGVGLNETLQEKQAMNTDLAEKAIKTELELEMDLFEAAEREEKEKLTSSSRSNEQGELSLHKGGSEVAEASKNERKRILDDTAADVSRVLRKKRGRRTHRVSITKEEDDVCFVCFDGGELVLCDRRTCPKAYHLSCIGRDAAFFEKKGSWFCGWHFCCGCCRPANLQCYTCPKAYCVGCSKEADFFIIRKRKGLCDDCLPIVKMIESSESVNADGVQVNFNDSDTYECLFKEYWEDLKSKFSLKLPKIGHDGKTIENASELVTEDNSDTDDESHLEISSAESDGEFEILDDGGNKTKERSTSKLVNEEHVDHDEWTTQSHEANVAGGLGKDSEQLLPREFDGWASKDLLEFLEFMNQDVKTSLSRFQVNKLLWNYIKGNKLQNQQKRTIIECDERLEKLFGKKSMHQYEMLKDIHLHYPPKGSSAKATSVSRRRRASSTKVKQKELQKDDQSVVDTIQEKPVESTPKLKRKHEASEVSKVDSNEYAAIIPQNISLIYLRRALLEDLLDDPEFENKVASTFVRIRVPSTGSKTETCYRLVQVSGTKVQSQDYKAGKKTTKVVLEIMNLHKKEELTIDLVSNQDFSVEECHRLRQSVKCHFIKALTVGEIEQKALALREAKLNDWFETEALRLSALRDRANEKGRKKELRECVEKLQTLSDLDFRAKKLRNRPTVIADPHMNPDYESEGEEEDLKNGEKPLASGEGRFGPGDVDTSSRRSREDKAQDVHFWDRRNLDVTGSSVREWDGLKSQSTGWESRKTKDQSGAYNGDNLSNHMQTQNPYKVETSRWEASKIGGKWGHSNEQEQVAAVDDNKETRNTQANWNNPQEAWQVSETWTTGGNTPHNFGSFGEIDNSGWNNTNAVTNSLVVPPIQQWSVHNPLTPSVPTPADSCFPAQMPAVVNIPSAETHEKEKLWHYQDPSGTIQGPFSMEQLRKWNTTGLFPLSLKIWKYNQPREESILLTDALAGRFAVNQAPWVPQAGTHGTIPYDSNLKGAVTSFRMNDRDTVGGPVVQRYVDGRRENESNNMAEFGRETEKGNVWGRGIILNQWSASQRRENESNNMAEFGMDTDKGNVWGRGIVPNQWPTSQRRENDSNSIAEFGMDTEKGNVWGRGIVPNQWPTSQRREMDSNSIAEFGMETPKGGAWGRGIPPNQWAANQRPWGPVRNQGSQGPMHNPGLGRGGGRASWNEPVHGPSAFGPSQQIEQRGRAKVTPCRYYQNGYCRKGDMCLFRHD